MRSGPISPFGRPTRRRRKLRTIKAALRGLEQYNDTRAPRQKGSKCLNRRTSRLTFGSRSARPRSSDARIVVATRGTDDTTARDYWFDIVEPVGSSAK